MKRGFLLIATGTPYYGNLALNCCLSIRANSNYPVMLLCTASAIEGIESQVEKYFAHVKIVPSEGAPMQQASKLKVTAYDYSPFEETIMLDGDTLILPGKSLTEWFDQKQDFVAYYHAVYDFEKGKADRENTTFWCNPEKVAAYDSKCEKMPQINASWIFFRKSEDACCIFDTARQIMERTDSVALFDIKPFRGFVNEEPCFNIACAFWDIPLDQIPYRPLYLQVFSETIDETYIQHRFKAFSMAGDIIHDQRVISLYNRLSDYYRAQYGIKQKFRFNATGKAGHNKAMELDKTVFVPTKKDNFIASIYLTGSKNNWNDFPEEPNIKLLENWAFSLKKTGLTGILFHNCFTKSHIQSFHSYPVEFSYVEMPDGHNSGLFRFEVYADFIQKYRYFIQGIFFTDSTDLEVLRNPFEDPFFKQDKIYLGCEEWDFNNWVKHPGVQQLVKPLPRLQELIQEPEFAEQIVLNAGLCGGSIDAIEPFIKRMAEECSLCFPNASFEDMGLLNLIAYTEFKEKISFGPHVNTKFKQYEKDNKFAYFKHK